MMSPIFIADHGRDGNLSEGRHAPPVVRLLQKGVHTWFQNPLGYTGGLTQPDRGSQDDDVRSEDLSTQFRPVIAIAFVGRHSRFDVEVDNSDDLAHYPERLQFFQNLLKNFIRRRGGTAALQSAIRGPKAGPSGSPEREMILNNGANLGRVPRRSSSCP